MKMTNRELETRYIQMKLTWKNLVNANVDLVDENKMLKGENERLNNIIKRLETDLYNMYITFGEFSEEYTENCIKKLKGVDEE